MGFFSRSLAIFQSIVQNFLTLALLVEETQLVVQGYIEELTNVSMAAFAYDHTRCLRCLFCAHVLNLHPTPVCRRWKQDIVKSLEISDIFADIHFCHIQ